MEQRQNYKLQLHPHLRLILIMPGAIKSARGEAAKYRTERNTALRLAHAYRTILEKHNINHKTVTPEAVEVLAIKDGAVVDEFAIMMLRNQV